MLLLFKISDHLPYNVLFCYVYIVPISNGR